MQGLAKARDFGFTALGVTASGSVLPSTLKHVGLLKPCTSFPSLARNGSET